jgi:beta-fructofuranosidase
MSLPRVLTLSGSGEMLINPPVEVEQLRYNQVNPADISLTGEQEQTVEIIGGNCYEWQLEINGKNADAFGIKVLCSPDGKEETVIWYDTERGEFVIDFKNSKAPGNVRHESYCMMGHHLKTFPEFVSEQRAPLLLKKGESLRLDVFVDKSIIEVFANGRQCVTQRVYPSLSNSTLCKVFSKSGAVKIAKMKFWQMAKTNFY